MNTNNLCAVVDYKWAVIWETDASQYVSYSESTDNQSIRVQRNKKLASFHMLNLMAS